MKQEDTFRFTMPAQLEKADDGKWKIRGLASEEVVDRQGEILIAKGICLNHIDEKKGMINWNHDNSPEATIGLLTGYSREGKKTYIEGELFKKHDKARAVHAIMESLQENGSRAMGISVEGRVVQRNPQNPKIIEKCIVKNVALTLSPVFDGSYAELAKSFGAAAEMEFDTSADEIATPNEPEPKTFSASEVVDLVAKALSVGAGSAEAPATRTGGDALAVEEMDCKKKKPATTEFPPETDKKEPAHGIKPAKLKQGAKELYKSHLNEIMDKICTLYPENSREEIWAAVKDRLSKKFPTEPQKSN